MLVSRAPARQRPRAADDLVIAGLVPMSTVDWPDHLTATVFLQGCPWNCFYCHNQALIPVRVPGLVAWQEVRDLLARRRRLLDGVVFTGGEALRQDALADAAAEVRRAGFAVGLHTAGAYPRRLADVLAAGLVDWVGLDVKALPDSYPQVVGRQRAGERAWECLRILIDAQAGASARPGPAEGGPPGSQGAPRDVAPGTAEGGPPGSQGAPRDVLPGTAGGGRDDQLPGLRVPPGTAGGASAVGGGTGPRVVPPGTAGGESEPSGAGATPSDLTFEVRTTVVPGDVTARDAYEVACRVHAAGARVYALQQARGQGTTGDFAVTAAGWDAACERLAGRIEALGWERFTYRPA